MFRDLLIAVLALRAAFCPLLCAGGSCGDHHDAIQRADVNAGDECDSCNSSERNAELPCDFPSDSSIPCDTGCVCHAAPGLSDRTLNIDLVDSLGLAAFQTESAWASLWDETMWFADYELLSHRFDADNGRLIRLAYASLLL